MIPAERMKAGREHRVPLSEAEASILEDMQAVRQGDVVFPSARSGQSPSSPTSPRTARSAFRDWAAERTNFPCEVAEMTLAHAIPDAVEAALSAR